MNEKGLGKRLQLARQAAGLTQQQLCQKANLSFSTLTKIERGAIKSPSIFTVEAIANALGTSLDKLIGHSPTPDRKFLTTKSGVKFIYFDVNGCLVHYYQRAFSRLATAIGVSSDQVETAFWHQNDDVCRGTITMKEFNDYIAQRLGVDSVDWMKYYLETVEPIKEMQELLKWASERYKVGLLTNIMPSQLKAMTAAGALPNIDYDVVIDSSEIGVIKPESKIFEIAQERAAVPSSEILLIDDARANVVAAEKHGWNVLWFDDVRLEESVERVRLALQPAE